MAEKIALQMNDFLEEIMRFAENKHEILLGACESDIKMTSTQEHILMLLQSGVSTNAKLAESLKVSPAAITKALKRLQEMGLVASEKASYDERIVFWSLSKQAYPVAQEHAEHHKRTVEIFEEMVTTYTTDEKAIIERFLTDFEGILK